MGTLKSVHFYKGVSSLIQIWNSTGRFLESWRFRAVLKIPLTWKRNLWLDLRRCWVCRQCRILRNLKWSAELRGKSTHQEEGRKNTGREVLLQTATGAKRDASVLKPARVDKGVDNAVWRISTSQMIRTNVPLTTAKNSGWAVQIWEDGIYENVLISILINWVNEHS